MCRGGDGGRGLPDPAGLMRARYTGAWLLLCAVLITGCATQTYYAPDDAYGSSARTAGSYVVQRGDTLYSIAWRNGLDYQTVAAWNRIAAPYTIYPGQRILLRPPGSAASRAKPAPSRQAPSASGMRPAPSVALSDGDPMPAWQWPATGPILRRFDANSTGKKGSSRILGEE